MLDSRLQRCRQIDLAVARGLQQICRNRNIYRFLTAACGTSRFNSRPRGLVSRTQGADGRRLCARVTGGRCDLHGDKRNPPGCLGVQGPLACVPQSDSMTCYAAFWGVADVHDCRLSGNESHCPRMSFMLLECRPAQNDTYTLQERRDHILVRSIGDVLWKHSYGRGTGKRSGIFARNCAFRCSKEHSILADLL
jgi:hypothetical protein